MSLLLAAGSAFSQDKRTMETRVADLLAQLPANDLKYTDKLMGDILALGEEGLNLVCSQIIPAGTETIPGHDSRLRAFPVFFRRRAGKQKRVCGKNMHWICHRQKDNGVKDFFMKQLQIIGGEATVEA